MKDCKRRDKRKLIETCLQERIQPPSVSSFSPQFELHVLILTHAVRIQAPQWASHSFFSSSFFSSSPPPPPPPPPPPAWFLPNSLKRQRCCFHSCQLARGTSRRTLTTFVINFCSFVVTVAFTKRLGAPLRSGISTSIWKSLPFSIALVAT